MSVAVILTSVFILLAQMLIGIGIVGYSAASLGRLRTFALSILTGMLTHTVVILILDIVGIPLSLTTVIASAVILAAASMVVFTRVGGRFRLLFVGADFNIRMYEVVVLIFAAYFFFPSFFGAWYWPVTPFDAMAGIDLVARQTVAEGTVNNEIFRYPWLEGRLSNQPFYAPFAMLMQVIYRLAGFAFGQVWLSVASICMIAFVWKTLRSLTHPFLAALLGLLYAITPEQYAYSLLLQTDWPNAIFFAGGGILVIEAFRRNKVDLLYLGSILLGMACWTRNETILILLLILPFIFFPAKRLFGIATAFRTSAVASSVGVFLFALWNLVYIKTILPVSPSFAGEWVGFQPARIASMMYETIFVVLADDGYWAGSFFLFASTFVVVLVQFLRRRTWPAGYHETLWVFLPLVALVVVSSLFSATVVEQTIRRGLFKIIPFMFLFVATSDPIQLIGTWIAGWEKGKAG